MVVKIEDIDARVRHTEYAVRGPIVARAAELEREGHEIIYCNIGNPQALKQKPLSWIRQVLALTEYPELLELKETQSHFPPDVITVAQNILKESKFGLGAYTDSKGMKFVREAVASFIRQRDDIEADAENVYLTDGASKGVQTVLRMLIAAETDGIMIPIPQYPLYSATITLYGGRQVGYYLDEASGWQLSHEELEKAYLKAQSQGTRVRAICVINPGNPTGAVLDEANIEMIIRFARERNLSILADEVYQENIYYPEKDTFHSFAKVLSRLAVKEVSLFSFHSCSKGFLGECGHRGGYFECRNVPAEVLAEITKMQSVALCANSVGQVVTYLMVRQPREEDASYRLYKEQRDGILGKLQKRAIILAKGLNEVPGVTCQPVTGAMYAFAEIKLRPGMDDATYCMKLLEETGICVVPGSGFGQNPGTFHFRTTILPPTEKIEQVVAKIASFHAKWGAQ
jgi:aspartate/methionine/tyrosine aminotransferase